MSLAYPLLLPLLALLGSLEVSEAISDKLYLKDIKALALHKGMYTKSRLNASIPEIQCTGGDAMGKIDPAVFFCYYKGHDGHEHNWECDTPTNHSQYAFGMMRVNCEGYSGAKDIHYVLRSSCGLEYTLEHNKTANATLVCPKSSDQATAFTKAVVYVLVSIAYTFHPVGIILCAVEIGEAVKVYIYRQHKLATLGTTTRPPYRMPNRYRNAMRYICVMIVMIMIYDVMDDLQKEEMEQMRKVIREELHKAE